MLIFLQVKGLRKYILFVSLFRCSGLSEMYIHWSSYTDRIACISGFIPGSSQHMYFEEIIVGICCIGGYTSTCDFRLYSSSWDLQPRTLCYSVMPHVHSLSVCWEMAPLSFSTLFECFCFYVSYIVSYILPVALELYNVFSLSCWEVKLNHNVFSLSHWEVKLYSPCRAGRSNCIIMYSPCCTGRSNCIIMYSPCCTGRSNCIIIYSPCRAGRSNCILPVALGGKTVS